MKPGDMVRFRKEQWKRKCPSDCGMWVWKLGLLVEYHSWEKIATVLCEGKLLRIHASEVEKAGKKDYERLES
tara:strand:- start:2572 stop:2787 length:216 start_codon:yes stop_codon:yes gene_type:complete